jgi:hypothetical protein
MVRLDRQSIDATGHDFGSSAEFDTPQGGSIYER